MKLLRFHREPSIRQSQRGSRTCIMCIWHHRLFEERNASSSSSSFLTRCSSRPTRPVQGKALRLSVGGCVKSGCAPSSRSDHPRHPCSGAELVAQVVCWALSHTVPNPALQRPHGAAIAQQALSRGGRSHHSRRPSVRPLGPGQRQGGHGRQRQGFLARLSLTQTKPLRRMPPMASNLYAFPLSPLSPLSLTRPAPSGFRT